MYGERGCRLNANGKNEMLRMDGMDGWKKKEKERRFERGEWEVLIQLESQ